MASAPDQTSMRQVAGFTLVELVIIIVILGIIAAVAVPKFANVADGARVNATKEEMAQIKRAIVGNPSAVVGGEYIDRGFEGDIGHPPSRLQDLVIKPDSIAPFDKVLRLGWNGPYLDGSNNQYATDAWGNAYNFDPINRRLVSTMGGLSGDSLLVTF